MKNLRCQMSCSNCSNLVVRSEYDCPYEYFCGLGVPTPSAIDLSMICDSYHLMPTVFAFLNWEGRSYDMPAHLKGDVGLCLDFVLGRGKVEAAYQADPEYQVVDVCNYDTGLLFFSPSREVDSVFQFVGCGKLGSMHTGWRNLPSVPELLLSMQGWKPRNDLGGPSTGHSRISTRRVLWQRKLSTADRLRECVEDGHLYSLDRGEQVDFVLERHK